MKPLIPFPKQIAEAELVREGKNEQVWRASFGGETVALRLGRFEKDRPLFEPSEIIWGVASIAERLGLTNTAKMVATGSSGEGFFVAERWIDGRGIDRETNLSGVAEDLMRLHAARKWHGGLRATRIVVSRGTASLVGLTWAMFLTTLTRESMLSFDQDLAPELNLEGPRAAGPANDVHGFARVLVAAGRSNALVERALSSKPEDRPTLVELAGECTARV